MLGGAQFVEALDRLGYPGASSLKASEFDWLFDCAPENLHFLRFVCRTLNQSNVLGVEEARAFKELKKSGKPLLDEVALGELLKSAGPSDGSGGNLLGPSSSLPSSVFATEDDVALEDLEVELEGLLKERDLKQQRYKRLQNLATSRSDVDLRLGSELEGSVQKLQETTASIGAENADTNCLLQKLTDKVKNLALYMPTKLEIEQNGKAEPKHPAALLSRLPLAPYLQQEELNTKTLTAFTQKHFFHGISDIVETSRSERFQVHDLSSCEDDGDGSKERKSEECVVERRRTEMARLQWAHIVAQHQLMQAAAEEKSLQVAVDWLAEKGSHTKNISMSSSLHVREVVSKKELQMMEAELEALLHGPVPVALKESARLLNVPVVRGDLDLQVARQDYYTNRQDQVRDYLLRQKACFDFVHLAQEMEMRRWKTCLQHLEEVKARLDKESEAATLRIDSLGHPDLVVNPRHNPIISCKDVAFSRLLQILEHVTDKSRSEPFRTYESLGQTACKLAGDLQATRDALAGAAQEQRYTAARLNTDCEALHRAIYTELQQLNLGPQVGPLDTTDQELLFPYAQELTSKLVEVDSRLQSLQHIMQEIMGEVKGKRAQLERNALLRQERELYVYFHLDPRLLQKVVEDLEDRKLKDTDPQVQRDGSRLSDTQEMEPLSSGVSTGTLSQAARKILAVLRAQSPHAGRRNQVYTYRHRQIEDRDASQRKFSAHRNMKMSPETSRGIETEGLWFGSKGSAFPTSCQSFTWCHSSPTPEPSLSSQDPSWISPCDSSLRASQNEAYHHSHMCSHRARADPPAQSDQALPFNENKMAQTLSLHPDGSGISSCFSLSGERENTPSVEEGRGVSKLLKNNELKGFCPENQNLFASENQLEQKEASGDVFEWKTEYKLEKKEGNVFTTEMHDGNNSSVGVTCLRTCQPENARVMPHHDKNVLMHTKFVLGDNTPVNIDSAQLQVIKARQEMESPEDKMDTALHLIVKEHGEDKRESFVENNDSADGKDESVMPPENTNESKRIEDSSRGSVCRSKSSAFLALCYHNEEVPKRNINRRRSSAQLASKSTFPTGHISTSVQDLCAPAVNASLKMKNTNLPSPTAETYHPHLIPFLSLKRKREVHENHKAQPPPNVCLTWPPPKWKPPHRVLKREVNNLADSIHGITTQSLANVGVVTGENKEKYNPKQLQQLQALPLKQAKEEAYVRGPHIQLKAHFLPTTLMFDPRVKDFEKLNTEEKMEIFEMARKASVLVLTLVYRDGSTQLDPEQKTTPPVCGLLMLMKSSADSEVGEDSLGPNDNIVYLKLQAWTKQQTHQDKELFMRDLLLQVLSRPQLVVCYKAKDLLRTALQCYKQEISWKQVAGCHIQDPQVSGWLLDPANPCSSYEDLLQKYCKIPRTTAVHGVKKVSQAISGLCSLYWLNVELSSRLQSLGLWDLYTDMELSMIPVLAVMESYHIHVDKEAFQRTSDMLGKKLKQLEQGAHRAAGEIFLITSNSQLRAVLFERLRLHERCENKKLPRTLNRQQSTSEAVLLQLQDLHTLPKIILEYRQVHKIKSTFVDGILSCVKNKDFISSKWHQTSAVTGRISSKHPNFQALPRQPLQITQKGSIQEKEEEVVKIHPRAMFIPQEGWTFVAADFCQVELRLLAHFSSDPELLRIFSHPQSDVFTMLASQWKGLSHTEVTSEDREHAKRIVYSVVYGAGRERLSGILGVSAEQASQFQDSFLQAYKDVQAFVQKTIQQCRQQGYVLSLMGRRRTLPNINVSDWAVRMQAERQAVNFVVQGSAADLCKTAMIRIFNLVSSSSRSARLVAQLHDELLYEVEDGEVQVFAALVKSTMESLQHIDHFGVHLKVPLKVAVSIGKSWGSMSELNIPATSPSAI